METSDFGKHKENKVEYKTAIHMSKKEREREIMSIIKIKILFNSQKESLSKETQKESSTLYS